MRLNTDFNVKLAYDDELCMHFDFSNYPKEQLFNADNEMDTLKIKTNFGGESIEEFVEMKFKVF